MKRLTLIAAIVLVAQVVMAGGILTNSNQSAQFVRMLSRNASTQIDAVYFNPAGVMMMENGFHIAVHNQSLFQTRTITTEATLNRKEFIGDVSAPAFPTAFAVYKMDKFAFSLGFGPNGGGGSANYKNGLPSFEKQVAVLPGSLTAAGVPTSAYSANINFDGQSVYWGIQLNGSYKVSDIFSVSAGVRVLLATNTYTGTMGDIKINPNQPAFGAAYNGSSMVSAPQFFTDAANVITGWKNGADAFKAGLTPIVSGGGGTVLLANGTTVGLTSTQIAQIQGLLGAAGLTPAQIGAINIQTAQATLTAASPAFATKAATMTAYSVATGNKEVDTKQTGKGYTPVIGINITPIENMQIGLRYEFKTALKLTNATKVDGTGLFPDGQKTSSDIPAILSAGVDYRFGKKMNAQLSYTNYFDKGVDWGYNINKDSQGNPVKRTIDHNLWEIALGLQYDISEKFAVSVGGSKSQTGVSEQYQSDFSYSNSSMTGAFGFQWKLNKALTLDAGMLYTVYDDAKKSFGTYSETYDKVNSGFAIGLSYSIF
jgi:long-subunit fatty acid transport protein